jgi:RimJ/RimL family protein N-acetyltransferase
VRQLESSDAEFCNNLWKFKDEKSEHWIRSLLEIHGGYALIDETTKEILSFVLISSQFAIGGLTTIEKARRKGYGEFMVKYLSKNLAKKSIIPLAYIADNNEKSLKLFMKLGFKREGGSNWIIMGTD